MAALLTLYFDFLSPYAYLSFKIMQKLGLKDAAIVRYMPVRLPVLIAKSGNHPPAQVPGKRAFIMRDLMRTAAFHGIIFRFPEGLAFPFNTRCLLGAAIAAKEPEQAIERMWDYIYGGGDAAGLAQLMLFKDPKELLHWLGMDAVDCDWQAVLKTNTNEALERGAFGVPVFIVQKDAADAGEFFFGSDRFPHILAYLGRHDWLSRLLPNKM